MRSTFTVSMAAAGALLATVAIPTALDEAQSATRGSAVEEQLLADAMKGLKRPMVVSVEELNDKEFA